MAKTLYYLVYVIFLCLAGHCLAAGGDMGLATDPLTDGSAEHPFLIEDLADFDTFADPNNADLYWTEGVYTQLTCDIDLAGRTYTTAVIAPQEDIIIDPNECEEIGDGEDLFDPNLSEEFLSEETGGDTAPDADPIISLADDSDTDQQNIAYEGCFDGAGYEIQNLTIDASQDEDDYQSFFGKCGLAGTIKNVGLTNAQITLSSHSTFSAGLCGINLGNIESCFVEVNITCDKFSDFLAGLCGLNKGAISESYADATITSGEMSDRHGAFCASNIGTITNSYALGDIVLGLGSMESGGFCGANSGLISFCYADVSISPTYYSGGLCAQNKGTIISCFWNAQTSQLNSSDGGRALTTAQLQDPLVFALNSWGGNPAWTIDNGKDYPRLAWENLPGSPIPDPPAIDWFLGSGTAEDPYQIDSAQALNKIGTASILWDKHFILTDDIDLTGVEYNRIGLGSGYGFQGEFDGNSHSIRYMNIDSQNCFYLGLFGCIESEGAVKNVTLQEFSIESGMMACALAGLCGMNRGHITQCAVNGDITANESIGGLLDKLAGLCGINEGSITHCCSDGIVLPENSALWVGGICGLNKGTLSYCLSNSNVSGSAFIGGICGENEEGLISHCAAEGIVNVNLTDNASGTTIMGGLCGLNHDGTIIFSYSKATVVGEDQAICIGGLCGSNTGPITNSYAIASVDTGSQSRQIGGLCGTNQGPLTHCYAAGAILCGENSIDVGGLCGSTWGDPSDEACCWDMDSTGIVESTQGLGKSTLQMKQIDTFLDAGWDFTLDDSDEACWIMPADDYPCLSWEQKHDLTMVIDSIKVKAGSRNRYSDRIVINASYWIVSEHQLTDKIQLNLYSADDQIPFYSEMVQIPDFKNERCIVRQGNSTFKFDLKNDTFQFTGKNMDLTGLRAPIEVMLVSDYCEISGIAYDGDAMGSGKDMDVINGRNDIPIALMSGVEDSLAVNKAILKPGKTARSDSLTVQGSITLANPADFGQDDMTIQWGDYSVQIDADTMCRIGKRNAFRYKKPRGSDSSVASAAFDLDKCTFNIAIRKTDIPDQPNPVNFGIIFGDYYQQTTVTY